jgi:RNA methyltransferase, TrmH family
MQQRFLTSKNNSLFKTIRLVASQTRRAPGDLVLAEGLRNLEEATRAGWQIAAVLASEEFGSTVRERELLAAWSERGINPARTTKALFDGVSSVPSPQGAIALVHVPELRLPAVRQADNPMILCACGVQDPGNLGTLVRTALAADASLVCTTQGTVSARNPKAVRASAGAFFRMAILERMRPQDLMAYCQRHSIRVYGTSARGNLPYSAVDFRRPSAILLGNEASGVSTVQWDGISNVYIPMAAGVESLNVAAAGAVLLFEARRQRLSESLFP